MPLANDLLESVELNKTAFTPTLDRFTKKVRILFNSLLRLGIIEKIVMPDGSLGWTLPVVDDVADLDDRVDDIEDEIEELRNLEILIALDNIGRLWNAFVFHSNVNPNDFPPEIEFPSE